MLIPVFTVYAIHLDSATPTLIGVALGSYGLSQGLLQIPFGMLSDRFGRKPILTIGLILFAMGSLLGALTHSIYGMIIARILQGMGAIGSVLIALLADLTPDALRTKAMAVIGMTIGMSFSLAMVMSPAIAHHYGLSGIFYFTVMLALLGLGLLHLVIPTPAKEPFHLDSEASPKLFKPVMKNMQLQRLNAGIFFQHVILTSTFYAIPLLLQQQLKQGNLVTPWHFYLPLMFFSFVVMVPFIILAEKKQLMKPIFLGSVAVSSLAQGLLALNDHAWINICISMFIYFVAFNVLEASLPSLISKQAGPESKGTAMGIYSSSQFLGIFVGGALAGVIYQWGNSQSVFAFNAIMGIVWFLIALKMKPNHYQATLVLNYSLSSHTCASTLNKNLLALPGVVDVVIAEQEGIIYLRVDRSSYVIGSAENMLNVGSTSS